MPDIHFITLALNRGTVAIKSLVRHLRKRDVINIAEKSIYLAVAALFGSLASTWSFWISCIGWIVFNIFLIGIKKYSAFIMIFIWFIWIIYFFNGVWNDSKNTAFNGSERNFIINIKENMKIDGDSMQGIVTVYPSNEKLMLKYKIKTKQEKRDLEKKFIYPSSCKITGTLQAPSKPRNENAFNYHSYLLRQKIYWILSPDRFNPQSCQPLKATPYTVLMKFRQKGISYLKKHFPEAAASLSVALIFGERDLLDEDVLKNYQQLGIIHLLAISGLHVGLLTGMLYYLAIRFGLTREKTLMALVIFLPIYALLTGGAPSVIRAVMMSIFVLLSLLWKRKRREPLVGLCIAFLLFLFVSPYSVFEPGFQLSFIVSLALILCAPYIFTRYKQWGMQLIVVSLTAQLASLPIIIYYFYEFSPLSILMNIFYVPVFSIIVLPLSLLTFLFHMIFPFIGLPLLFILNFIIAFINKLAQMFAALPFSTVTLGRPNFIILLCLSGSICLFFYLWENNEKKKKLIFPQFFIPLFVLCIHWGITKYSSYGEVTFIDVGQGDSIFIQLPNDKGNYLIDTGGVLHFEKDAWRERRKRFDTGKDILTPFLKSKGITCVDKLILTHGDADHIGGALGLLDEVKVKEILLPNMSKRSKIENIILDKAKEKKINVRFVTEGEKWKKGNALFQIISPEKDREETERNNSSIVIYAKIGRLNWLFTGDLEIDGEERLINTYSNLKVDVLKAGHHGSRTSTSEHFLDHIHPLIAIISAGVSNRYGHPHVEVLSKLAERNIRVYRTNDHGAITYKFRDKEDGTFSHVLP
ncbi:DNA internalization-related competence protein ComEC/Rec2 [Bacillus aquiflavi]|uniref:DNA internalization-related competence protein ComEC/Rec2 n=1 Tax=Bacillus aquiflavi TaxID=2672567 RepID=UPI001CA86392|nr:DNA internalization-related competence protein ComEC/Rec2 [Bacillus aquiflavi]UAC47314.1 DNA internalization-related competence protein ComEC/Rec2 [Bacillus aquiflavi]